MAGLGLLGMHSFPKVISAMETQGESEGVPKAPLGLCNHSLRGMRLKAEKLIEYAIENRLDSVQFNTLPTFESLETALKLYKLDNGLYPETEQGLQALVVQPETEPVPRKWREGGYLDKGKVPKDPWGKEFAYLSPGAHGDYDIISYGADGIPGGEGKNKDITSWEIE